MDKNRVTEEIDWDFNREIIQKVSQFQLKNYVGDEKKIRRW